MNFSGTVTSDFLKLLTPDNSKKGSLINYAATDFLSLRDALINYVKAVYPLDYNYFSESDFGMMLIELVAYMGAQLSMKADYLANENYLRTCRNRNSLAKLLELIGIRMKGPISAAANAKLTLQSTPSWDNNTDYVSIGISDRIVNITSPEDGGNLTYTLYKVETDGNVDVGNSDGSIILNSDEKDSDTVFSNLVLLEGALVKEQGTFETTEAIKTIKLTQYPVVEGSIQVYVSGATDTQGVYSQVENIYFASGGSDKVFQVVSNDNFAATVVFGDSVLGSSPANGDTYTVFYRIGGGSRGNIASEIIDAPITTVFHDSGQTTIQGTIENISEGTGGADSETMDHAKKYYPLVFRSQDRLVTLLDYKGFCNTFISNYGSTGKSTAVVRRAYSGANLIDIYVLEKSSDTQLRRATPQYKRELLEAISDKKMLTDEPVIVDGLIRTFDVALSVYVDSKYKTSEELIKLKIKNKIVEYFNIDNTDFGKNFVSQDLNRAIFDLVEVRFSKVDNLPDLIKIEFNEVYQLNNLTINVNYV